MTIVVTWKDIEHNNLWVAADSRLLLPKNHHNKFFECGAKIFQIPVICFKPDTIGFFEDNYFTMTIGMAFAGSSILALNLYTFLSHAFGNLASDSDQVKPSILDLAKYSGEKFRQILNNYLNKNLEITDDLRCEFLIFGFCPIIKTHELYHISHSNKTLKIFFSKIDIDSDEDIHIMGNHKDEISALIQEQFNLKKQGEQIFGRIPINFIEKTIQEEKYESIGGDIQLGRCSTAGFNLYTRVRPAIPGLPHPKMIFQGLDLPLLEYVNDFLTIKRDGIC